MRDKMEGRSTRGRFPLLALWQLQVPVISKDYQPPLLPQFVYIVLYYIVQIYCILYYILNILYILLYCYIVLHSAAVNYILQFSFATSQQSDNISFNFGPQLTIVSQLRALQLTSKGLWGVMGRRLSDIQVLWWTFGGS